MVAHLGKGPDFRRPGKRVLEVRPPMALTDLEIRQANPRDREWKLTDGSGLYLLVRPNGSKLWRFKYRALGKEQKLSFGRYPEIGLKEARLRRDEARVEIGRGGDPARR